MNWKNWEMGAGVVVPVQKVEGEGHQYNYKDRGKGRRGKVEKSRRRAAHGGQRRGPVPLGRARSGRHLSVQVRQAGRVQDLLRHSSEHEGDDYGAVI